MRFRLAAWNAIVVVLTALVTLLALREGVRWTLVHEMDQILIEDAHEVLLALAALSHSTDDLSPLTDELQRKALGHRQHGWFVELRNDRGDVLWTSMPALEAAGATPRSGDAPLELNVPATLKNFRVLEVSAPPASRVQDVRRVRVGARLEFLAADMLQLDRWMMFCVAGLLLIAPLCGYWLARRAARTIGEIITTAARLRPDRLDERLPIQGTEDELDQLAHTVNGLLDRIAIYLQQRRDFLANAAHELRTPLAAIRSSVEVALSGDRSGQEYQELLEDVIEEGTALETLVNQLLLLSEVEAERLNAPEEEVPLQQVVTKAVEMFRGVAESRNVALEVTQLTPVTVAGYRHQLRQVVNNLIDNALKYTPSGGSIRIDLRPDDSGKLGILKVSDTGIGIPAEDLPRIFERFYRVDRSRRRESAVHGSGLGLSICLAVITAHGGQIACRSALGGGSTFEVRLPIAPARAERDPLHAENPVAAGAG